MFVTLYLSSTQIWLDNWEWCRSSFILLYVWLHETNITKGNSSAFFFCNIYRQPMNLVTATGNETVTLLTQCGKAINYKQLMKHAVWVMLTKMPHINMNTFEYLLHYSKFMPYKRMSENFFYFPIALYKNDVRTI